MLLDSAVADQDLKATVLKGELHLITLAINVVFSRNLSQGQSFQEHSWLCADSKRMAAIIPADSPTA